VGAVVVAEGIETAGELDAVRTAGVTRGQGFGLAPPQRLPLAPLSYAPTPFLSLVHGAPDEERPVVSVDARREDPTVAAHRIRAALASMTNGAGRLRRSDGSMGIEEFRAICSGLIRQIDLVSSHVEDLTAGMPSVAATESP
jgi:hypothetical protein